MPVRSGEGSDAPTLRRTRQGSNECRDRHHANRRGYRRPTRSLPRLRAAHVRAGPRRSRQVRHRWWARWGCRQRSHTPWINNLSSSLLPLGWAGAKGPAATDHTFAEGEVGDDPRGAKRVELVDCIEDGLGRVAEQCLVGDAGSTPSIEPDSFVTQRKARRQGVVDRRRRLSDAPMAIDPRTLRRGRELLRAARRPPAPPRSPRATGCVE